MLAGFGLLDQMEMEMEKERGFHNGDGFFAGIGIGGEGGRMRMLSVDISRYLKEFCVLICTFETSGSERSWKEGMLW